jgi:sigma-B regulation protein RsbU (phosphoserine phosphatase)
MVEEADEVHRLACLELRGGNHLASYFAELPGLSGWVSCHPLGTGARGGDMYYLSSCSQGAIARVVLADVAGHGELVSSAAVRLRHALRQHVDHWDQSTLVRQLNDNFLQGGQLLGSRKVQYATAFLASFYAATGELLFTNAGHVPPLWYRAAASEWSLLYDTTPLSKEITDLPLGLIAGTSYSQTAVQLEPGDLLLLYTDGISESSDESGVQLGLPHLLSIARNLPTASAAAAGKGLLAGVAQFRGASPVADDETVVALQRRGL